MIPTSRVANLGPAGLTVALAGGPALILMARGETVTSAPLVLVGLASGAALGWAADDPAADLLASTPVPAPVRTALRAGFVVVVASVVLALVAAVVSVGPGWPPGQLDRLPEAAAAAGIALAVGLAGARRGDRGVGVLALTSGLLVPAFISALAYRWPTLLPAFVPGPTHVRWWLVAGVGAALVTRVGRDPSRR